MVSRVGVIGSIGLVLCLGAQGCAKRNPPSSGAAPARSTSDDSDRRKEESDELLASVIANLQSSVDDSVYPTILKQLNQYLKRNLDAVPTLSRPAAEQVASLLGAAAADDAAAREFIPSDAEYLRSSLFARSVARRLEAGEPDSLAVARKLFEWTVDQVASSPPGWRPEGPPLDVALRGAGDGNERAWIFLELVRQAGLQGCMVGIPAPGGVEGVYPWLVGVVLGAEVHLFEPALGLEARAADGKNLTLRRLAADPERVLQFNPAPADHDKSMPEYGVKPGDVKAFSLLMVAQAPMLAPRMAFLENRLSGPLRVNLTIKLEESFRLLTQALESIGPGQAGVRVWQYPELVVRRFLADRGTFYRSVNLTWFRNPRSPRFLQLRGEENEAVNEFVRIDMENAQPAALESALVDAKVPLEVRRNIIELTPQDVLYFTGLAKLSAARSRPEVALEWFRRYLDHFGTYQLRPREILDPAGFIAKLSQPAPAAPAAGRTDPAPGIWRTFSDQERERFSLLGASLAEATRHIRASEAVGHADWENHAAPLREVMARLDAMPDPGAAAAGSAARDATRQAIDHFLNQSPAQTHLGKARQSLAEALAEVINRELGKPGFLDVQSFANVAASGSIGPELRALLAADVATLGEEVIRRRNRLLLGAAFPDELLPGRRPWIAAAARMSGLALARGDQWAEAKEVLTRDYPALLPMEKVPLRVLARILKQP